MDIHLNRKNKGEKEIKKMRKLYITSNFDIMKIKEK